MNYNFYSFLHFCCSANEDDPEEISDSDNKKETKTPKGPSKREIKRTKAAQKELERLDQHKQETTQKALNYLSMVNNLFYQ